jgi:transcriptional regulator PpsR
MTSLGSLDAAAAATLIAAASDLALVIGNRGEILDVSVNSQDLARDLDVRDPWLNRPWIDTVAADSRPKVEMLLRDAAGKAAPRGRHLNHLSRSGGSVPILYSAVQFGDQGRVVALGRDLRSVSELQQRLVDAQQSLEQDYSRLRDMEMRYRLLFQTSSEAVLVLDTTSQRVVEANAAAHQLFGGGAARAFGRNLAHAFAPPGPDAVQALFTRVRALGHADDIRARLEENGAEVRIAASLFREGAASRFLVRLVQSDAENAQPAGGNAAQWLDLVAHAPDGFVIIDADGSILAANPAFLSLAQRETEAQIRGQSLDRWLGRQGVDLSVLTANLRQRGSVRLFATIMRGESGASTPVEVSGVTLLNPGGQCFGLAIREVRSRLSVVPSAEPPRPAGHLADMIGRVPLKELVRQSTDVIEKLCIETALQMTNDNRASAAEMLGLSRQSLYVKLRRYGLGDLSPDEADPS